MGVFGPDTQHEQSVRDLNPVKFGVLLVGGAIFLNHADRVHLGGLLEARRGLEGSPDCGLGIGAVGKLVGRSADGADPCLSLLQPRPVSLICVGTANATFVGATEGTIVASASNYHANSRKKLNMLDDLAASSFGGQEVRG